MKRFISILISFSTILFFSSQIIFAESIDAKDMPGSAIFSTNCAMCHAGGNNVVNPIKTLTITDLKKYGMYSEDAIIKQVTLGNGGMPSFQDRIDIEDIQDVAQYVLAQSTQGW
uniref:Cytochrome c-553 n=1 Tax=Sonderella linearis TaxID=110477 RepID=A0A1Z1MLM7_9FLOR|nr:cytochrome c553 [Sonderella linearis]ARW66948.1 cytochrome c553 [Sonderella linearis]